MSDVRGTVTCVHWALGTHLCAKKKGLFSWAQAHIELLPEISPMQSHLVSEYCFETNEDILDF